MPIPVCSWCIVNQNQITMSKWERQSQERDDQKYFFNGRCFITKGAQEVLSEEEAIQIVRGLQQLAIEEEGLDYLQSFKRTDGTKIWVIDQLDSVMKKEHPPEHNYFTILLPSEY